MHCIPFYLKLCTCGASPGKLFARMGSNSSAPAGVATPHCTHGKTLTAVQKLTLELPSILTLTLTCRKRSSSSWPAGVQVHPTGLQLCSTAASLPHLLSATTTCVAVQALQLQPEVIAHP